VLLGLIAAAAVLACPGIASAQATCTMNTFPPVIVQQPTNQTIASGATATITTTASAFPPGCPLFYVLSNTRGELDDAFKLMV